MIKTVHSVGFSLTEIKEIQKNNTDSVSIDTKIKLLQEKIEEVEKQKDNLNKTEDILRKMLRNKLNSKIGIKWKEEMSEIYMWNVASVLIFPS